MLGASGRLNMELKNNHYQAFPWVLDAFPKMMDASTLKLRCNIIYSELAGVNQSRTAASSFQIFAFNMMIKIVVYSSLLCAKTGCFNGSKMSVAAGWCT